MTIELTKLPSGLRIITDHVPTVDSVALGVWADVGTRDEDMAHNGVAHMVEHMMFKGTIRRTAARIAEEVEDVGGNINAWTSREMTSYHIHLLKEDMPLAVDILADVLQHSTMPEDEIERERHVILQEIGMTLDTPDELVFDHYQETAYPGQTLGAPILGTSDIIKKMKKDTLHHYVREFYTPARLVLAAAGNIKHGEFTALAEKMFSSLPADRGNKQKPAQYRGGENRMEKDLEQSHVVLGFQGVKRGDDAYFAVILFSVLFGGGMSSRLFQEIREKRGLVYSIFSHHAAFADDGQFMIYAGTGPDDIPKMMPVLCDEIKKVMDGVTEDELKRAKAQMRAGLLMAQESMMSRANQIAKNLIYFNKTLDLREKLRKIEAVTVSDIRALTDRIFSGAPTLAALGPLEKLESFDALKKRLAA
ncbi:MAG: insulinase family protein [Proteobacteria bacterium]|nr:insulinase family protein [Pseudomonadota bacterium]